MSEPVVSDYAPMIARFDAYVKSNIDATGRAYITTNELKALVAEFKIASASVKAIRFRSQYQNVPKYASHHPGALQMAVKAVAGGKFNEELPTLKELWPQIAANVWTVIRKTAERIVDPTVHRDDEEDDEEGEPAALMGLTDVKVMLAHYEKARLRVSELRERADKLQLDLTAAEKDLERYKPIAKTLDTLKEMATRLKNNEV